MEGELWQSQERMLFVLSVMKLEIMVEEKSLRSHTRSKIGKVKF